MIRLGVCTAIENIASVQKYGFDYIETGLATVSAMDENAFHMAALQVDKADIKVEAFNGMLPASVRVTGPDVNAQQIHDYLSKAFARAVRLGGKVVVFGSSAARNVPDGFSMEVAWRQIMNFLRVAEKHALNAGLTVAIEPLRRAESNIINLVTEAVLLSSLAQLPHIRVLGDTYHMAMASEPLSSFLLAGELLAHVHICNSLKRSFPKEGDGEDYKAIFSVLQQAGYEGRVSIEAGCTDFDAEAPEAFRILDAARKAV